MRRTPLASERIQMIDPTTGIKVIQLTSYPSPSVQLGYDWPSITPEGRVILCSQRWLQRNAPWDIWRVDADGLNLFQLTERDDEAEAGSYDGHNRPNAKLSLDGRTLYVLWNGDPNLYAVDVETGAMDRLASLERFCPEGVTFQHVQVAPASNRLYIVLRWPRIATIRVDLATGAAEELDLDGFLWAIAPSARRIILMRNAEIPKREMPDYFSFARAGGQRTMWSMDEDGGDARFLCPWVFAHATVLGDSMRLQGCGIPPERCVIVAEEGKEPERIVQGPYFWHSGASYDGEWIVTDTNWPDCGLQLVHVPTRHVRTLCHPGASLEHADFGHPHPGLSRDGRIAVFHSDRTGVSQVYVAHVSDEFRESVKAGVLDRPRDKWI